MLGEKNLRRQESNRERLRFDPSVITGFELQEGEITRIDELLAKAKDQEKIGLKQYEDIMFNLKSVIYKIKDNKRIMDFWFEVIDSFKDKDTATAILMSIEKYRYKEKAA